MSTPPELLTRISPAPAVEVERILFVCTANVCRSPMAAALLKSTLGELPNVSIASAGILDRHGQPLTKEVNRAVKRLGLDLAGHRASPLSSSLEPLPDLVLVMARHHLSTLFDIDAGLLTRSFTLKEFVRLSEIEGQRLAGEEIGRYIARVASARRMSAVLLGTTEDVEDPMGKRKSAYEKCGAEIKALVERLSKQLYLPLSKELG